MDANRPGWYVRHVNFVLMVEQEYDPQHPEYFDDDASFIMHADRFHPGYYGLEAVNFANYYVHTRTTGHLGIAEKQDTDEFYDTASFRISGFNVSGK